MPFLSKILTPAAFEVEFHSVNHSGIPQRQPVLCQDQQQIYWTCGPARSIANHLQQTTSSRASFVWLLRPHNQTRSNQLDSNKPPIAGVQRQLRHRSLHRMKPITPRHSQATASHPAVCSCRLGPFRSSATDGDPANTAGQNKRSALSNCCCSGDDSGLEPTPSTGEQGWQGTHQQPRNPPA
jgi:hypothetical protein